MNSIRIMIIVGLLVLLISKIIVYRIEQKNPVDHANLNEQFHCDLCDDEIRLMLEDIQKHIFPYYDYKKIIELIVNDYYESYVKDLIDEEIGIDEYDEYEEYEVID